MIQTGILGSGMVGQTVGAQHGDVPSHLVALMGRAQKRVFNLKIVQ